MTQGNDLNKSSGENAEQSVAESTEQQQWHKVFSGGKLPAAENPVEQEADHVRQALLWYQAQNQSDEKEINAQQAAFFYQQVHARLQEASPGFWQRWGRFLLFSTLLLSIGTAIGWFVASSGNSIQAELADEEMLNVPTQQKQTEQTVQIAEEINRSHAPLEQLNEANDKVDAKTSNSPITTHEPLSWQPEMIDIPAGQFIMGCSPGWDDIVGGCRESEYPAHEVKVAGFQMARYEVTVAQFRYFVEQSAYVTTAEQDQLGCTIRSADAPPPGWLTKTGYSWRNPGFEQRDDHPVVCISWVDAQSYIQWLNQKTQKSYRLPTEAEWEYAARGGRATAFYWGNQASRHHANYQGRVEQDQWMHTSPVGRFTPNSWGLHDISGNAWEWVEDCWTDNYQLKLEKCADADKVSRVRRGGGWDNLPPNIRSAYRSFGTATDRSYVYGFRLAHDKADSTQ